MRKTSWDPWPTRWGWWRGGWRERRKMENRCFQVFDSLLPASRWSSSQIVFRWQVCGWPFKVEIRFSNVQLELMPKCFTRWKLNEFEIDWKIEISRPKNLEQRQQVHGTVPMHREISEILSQLKKSLQAKTPANDAQCSQKKVKVKSWTLAALFKPTESVILKSWVNLCPFHNTHNGEKEKD